MTVKGTSKADIIDHQDGVTDGVDLIYGFGGDDLIFGLGGNDLITGGAGADAIYGGSGTDTASYHDSDSAVWVDLSTRQGYTGIARGDTLFSIENLNGSYHDDLLIGDDGANAIAAYNGRDILKGGGGADLLSGFEGDDFCKAARAPTGSTAALAWTI